MKTLLLCALLSASGCSYAFAQISQQILASPGALTVVEGQPAANAGTGSGLLVVSLAMASVGTTYVFTAATPSGEIAWAPSVLAFPNGSIGPVNVLVLGRQDADSLDESADLTFSGGGAAPLAVPITVWDDD